MKKKLVVPVMVASLAVSSLGGGTYGTNLCNIAKAEEALLTETVDGMVIENGVLKRYEGNASEIVVPEGVVSIGEHAFEYKDFIKSVTLPKSVKEIGQYAFYQCKNLETVETEGSIEKIGSVAFSVCESLSSITNIENVKYIEHAAFNVCKKLKEISLNSIEDMGDSAFSCSGLEKVEINFVGKDCKIGYDTFGEAEELKEVVIKGAITEIGGEAFLRCKSLENIEIEDTSHLTCIGSRVFDGTPWLTAQLKQSENKMLIINDILVKYEPNVFYAGEYEGIPYEELSSDADEREKMKDENFTYTAPEQAKMETVTIPGNVKMIAGKAFYGAYSVEKIEFDPAIKELEIGEGAFDFTTWEKEYLEKEDFLVIGGKLVKANYNAEVIEVPNGVEEVVPRAFKVCYMSGKLPTEEVAQVKKVVFPSSLKTEIIEGYHIVSQNQKAHEVLETIVMPTIFSDVYSSWYVPKYKFEDVETSTDAKDILQGYKPEDSSDTDITTPTPAVTETPAPTDEVTETQTPQVTQTPEPTKSVAPTSVPQATETPIPTEKVEVTPTVKPANTPEPTKSVAPAQTVKPTDSATPISTPTPTENVTVAPTSTPTANVTVTLTSTPAPTAKATVKVKKAVIKKANRVSGTKIKVTMKKVEKVKGYQILVSTDKKFKKIVKKTTFTGQSVTIKKLKKGKKYYVKVRAYKAGDGKKKVYGTYSAYKKVK